MLCLAFCLTEFILLVPNIIKPDETQADLQSSKTFYVPKSSLHSNNSETFRHSSSNPSSSVYFNTSSARSSSSTQSTFPSSSKKSSSDNETSSEQFVDNEPGAAASESTSVPPFESTYQTDEPFRASSSSSYNFVFTHGSRSSQKGSNFAPKPTRLSPSANQEQLSSVQRYVV